MKHGTMALRLLTISELRLMQYVWFNSSLHILQIIAYATHTYLQMENHLQL